MCTYLDKVEATYYFRRAVPKELQPLVLTRTGNPRTEWKVSLRTKDREKAKRALRPYVDMSDREIDAARLQLRATSGPPLPTPHGSNRFDPFEGMTQEAFERWEQHQAEEARRAADEDDAAEQAEAWERGLPPDHHAVRLLNDAREQRDRYRDRYYVRKARDHRHADAQQPREATFWTRQPPTPSVTIAKVFEGYASQEGSNPSTVSQFRSIIKNLIAFLGHDDAKAVSHADIIGWLDHLRSAPVARGKQKGKPRSATTINESYLAAVKAVFAYGRQALLLDTNPALEVKKIRAAKPVKLRDKDLTRAERKTILSAALVTATGKLSPQRALARRWVPWLCAYTGARVNEMTQLRREDVRQIDGVWTIRVTPEAGRQKTNEARLVPLHEHLIELGFIAAINGKGAGHLFFNPDDGRGGTVKPQSVKVGQFLANWVREDLGIIDPDIQPNHAWRHTFKTICFEAGIEERAADYMQGHASKGQGRKYGANTVAALAAQLAKFPRYDLAE